MNDLMFETATPAGEEAPKRALRVTADMVRSALDGAATLADALAAPAKKAAAPLPPPPVGELFPASAAGA